VARDAREVPVFTTPLYKRIETPDYTPPDPRHAGFFFRLGVPVESYRYSIPSLGFANKKQDSSTVSNQMQHYKYCHTVVPLYR
jgi:hypothetical protein